MSLVATPFARSRLLQVRSVKHHVIRRECSPSGAITGQRPLTVRTSGVVPLSGCRCASATCGGPEQRWRRNLFQGVWHLVSSSQIPQHVNENGLIVLADSDTKAQYLSVSSEELRLFPTNTTRSSRCLYFEWFKNASRCSMFYNSEVL